MSVVSTDELVLATLASNDDPGEGVSLSALTETIGGDGARLSRQVELTLAIETLREEGFIRQEEGPSGELLGLTADGRERASVVHDRLLDTEIEVVEADGRRQLSLGEAARQLLRPPVAIAADCSDDGVYYRQDDIPSEGLVGRDEESAQFRDVLDRVRAERQGEAVVVSGPGGVGKTTFAETVLDQLPDGVEPLAARCQEAGDEPYQPIRDLVAQLDVEDPFVAAEFDVEGAEAYEAQQTALFHDVTAALSPETGSRVLFLDDVDFADPATWTYVEYLCEHLREHRLLLLLTHRPGTLPESAAIRPGESDAATTRIELTGLDRAETGRLIERILNRRGVPEAFADAVHERTDGNPLFVETTVETLLDRDELDPQFRWYPESVGAIDLPAVVRDTVVERLESLDAAARDVLSWVAVAGEAVPVRVLRAVCDVTDERVGTIVDVLCDAELLEADRRAGERQVTLRSNVVREAVLADIPDPEREGRHADLADVFETIASEASDDETAVERAGRIAYHHERAANGEAAIEWYRTAAERATDVYAHETAIEQYHHVLDIARSSDATDEMLSAATRLADVYLTTSDYEQASRYVRFVRERTTDDDTDYRRESAVLAARIAIQRSEFADAVAEATAGLELTDDPDGMHCRLLSVKTEAEWRRSNYDAAEAAAETFRDLARDLDRTALQAEANELLAMIHQERSEYDRAEEYYRAALEKAQAVGDRHHQADVRNGLGIVSHRRGDEDEAREYYQQALETMEAVGDRHQAAKLYNNLAIVADNQGNVDQAHEYYHRAIETADAVGDRSLAAAVRLNLGSVFSQRGEYDRSQKYTRQALETLEAVDNDHVASLAMLNLAADHVALGEYEDAHEHLEDALAIIREIGDDYRRSSIRNTLGALAIEEGEYRAAESHFDEALEAAKSVDNEMAIAEIRRNQGQLARRRDEPEQAVEYAQTAVDLLEDIDDDQTIGWALWVRGLAETDLGAFDGAQESLEAAQDLFEEFGNSYGIAQVQRASGRLAREREEYDRARDMLQTALETNEDVGATPAAARTRRELGRVAAATDDPERARTHWQDALGTFAELGATADAIETLDLLVTHRPGDSPPVREWCERGIALAEQLETALAADARSRFAEHRDELGS